MRKLPVLLAVATLLVAACGGTSPPFSPPPVTPTAAPPTPPGSPVQVGPVFQWTTCRFSSDEGLEVDCGDLIVPENREQPTGATVRLHVAIFHPMAEANSDPVIYLHGGPGAGILSEIGEAYGHGYQYLFPDRNFVVFDQRGAGYAQPRLDCPDQAKDYAASLTRDERMGLLQWDATQMAACQERLSAGGVDPSAYASRDIAADLDDLITALGYEQVNLFGESYGSYLALTYLQKYGQKGRVRSVVLVGVYPLQADIFAERAANAQKAFDAIFAACASDPACARAYPGLPQVFYRLLEQLEAQPVTIQAPNPLTNQAQDVVVNGYRLLEVFYRSCYDAGWIPLLPKMLYDMQAGNYDLLSEALQNVFWISAAVDDGAYYAVQCSDEAPFTDPRGVSSSAGLHSLVRAYFDGGEQAMLKVCASWPIRPVEVRQNQAVSSDVPTLLLSGAFDPVTPPAWAGLAAATLSHSYAYTFPAEAHGLATDSCGYTLIYDFVQFPQQPRADCLRDLPQVQFVVPGGP